MNSFPLHFNKGLSEQGLPLNNQNVEINNQPNSSLLYHQHHQQDETNKLLEEVLKQLPSNEGENILAFRDYFEEFFSKPVNYPYISDRSETTINLAKLFVIKYRETKQEYHEEKKRADEMEEMVKDLQRERIAEQEKREFQFEKEKLQFEKREMQMQRELDKLQCELEKVNWEKQKLEKDSYTNEKEKQIQCEIEKLQRQLEKVNSEKNEQRLQFEKREIQMKCELDKLQCELQKVNLEKHHLEKEIEQVKSSITNSHTNEQILNKLLGMEQSKGQVSVPTITPITFKEILKEKRMQRYVYGNLKHVLSMSEREELRPHRMTGEFQSMQEMIQCAGEVKRTYSPKTLEAWNNAENSFLKFVSFIDSDDVNIIPPSPPMFAAWLWYLARDNKAYNTIVSYCAGFLSVIRNRLKLQSRNNIPGVDYKLLADTLVEILKTYGNDEERAVIFTVREYCKVLRTLHKNPPKNFKNILLAMALLETRFFNIYEMS